MANYKSNSNYELDIQTTYEGPTKRQNHGITILQVILAYKKLIQFELNRLFIQLDRYWFWLSLVQHRLTNHHVLSVHNSIYQSISRLVKLFYSIIHAHLSRHSECKQVASR